MNIDLKSSDKVVLISFNGSLEPDIDIQPHENYWKLIHQKGIVVQDPTIKVFYKTISGKKRVLVKFDKNIKSFGLECHNPIKNSLWIQVNDLNRV